MSLPADNVIEIRRQMAICPELCGQRRFDLFIKGQIQYACEGYERRRTHMPRLIDPVAPVDGRQSETALFVARGTRRLLRAKGFSSVVEMSLQSGRRADIVALSGNGSIHIIEVKSSIADFRADTKWRDYRLHCDRLFFAIPTDVPAEIMPEDAGLIIADAYGAAIVRDAPEHRLAGATRRAMMMRYAQTAAHRLHTLGDPQIAALQPLG